MSKLSRILSDSVAGDSAAANQLLPLVYDELRSLAANKLRRETPGQTLQPTALVHEAYLRLAAIIPAQNWTSRSHFIAAAGEAMRRILVERARRKQAIKHGGAHTRRKVPEDAIAAPETDEKILQLDEALNILQQEMPRKAEIVKLRFFVGMSSSEAAEVLGISVASAERDWTYARAWLQRQIEKGTEKEDV